MQTYLKPDNKLSPEFMKKIFMIRTRNLNIKENFPGKFNDKKCVAINCDNEDTQLHLYHCEHLESENTTIGLNLPYDSIFEGSVEQQVGVMHIMMKRFERRNQLMSSNQVEDPMDPELIISGIQ